LHKFFNILKNEKCESLMPFFVVWYAMAFNLFNRLKWVIYYVR